MYLICILFNGKIERHFDTKMRGVILMGKSGVISKNVKEKDNEFYHDIISLFQIYRAVNWKMQIKINQVKQCFHTEYGMDVDEFLESVYQAGMDINLDMENMRERIESINQANKYLKLIDEAVELMRKYHPQGEKYYWVLYYTYMSAYRAENIDEILEKLEPHFPRIPRIHKSTYRRWREQAFEAVGNILWGYEVQNLKILEQVNQCYRD